MVYREDGRRRTVGKGRMEEVGKIFIGRWNDRGRVKREWTCAFTCWDPHLTMKMRKKIFTIHRSGYKDLTSYSKIVAIVKITI